MRLIYLMASFLLCHSAFAQNFWQEATENDWQVERSADRTIHPQSFRAIEIAASTLQEIFYRQVDIQTLAFPLPDGSTKLFQLEVQSNFHPELARKYPQIRSFVGRDPLKPHHRIAVALGPKGFYAVFQTEKGEVYIDPYQKSRPDRHMVYFTRDHHLPEALSGRMHCGNQETSMEEWMEDPVAGVKANMRSNSTLVDLLVYDIAIATTGEYAQANGGTAESVLEAINVALTRVNFVFVQDLAIRFQLIPENEDILFFDPATDPYNDDNIPSLLNQNRTTLANILGPDKYDLGHVFAGPCGGGTVGQAALAGTCNTQRKAQAASCQLGNNDRFYINVVAHEIGHQFNATHTFNNCPPNEGQTSPSSAFEPGGGSTIMSYADACGTQSFQNSADPYFHVHSLDQMYVYSRNSSGSNCSEVLPTSNVLPELTIPYRNHLAIPVSTLFKLTAEATDENDSTLTYCWEQYNLDPVTSALGAPQGNDPSFRSFEPVSSPTRYLPRLPDILIGNESPVEVLPDYARDLTFRCTVRDNDLVAGGVVWEEINLRVTEQAGPFEVIAPNRNLVYTGGREYEVRWEVANTDQSPVNCQFVNVLLSLDRGVTIYDTLARQTRNDGSVFVTFPNLETNRGRVFVEAADNVFYDVSDEDFTISPATDTTFSAKLSPAGIPLSCQPEMVAIQVVTDSINGYREPIQLSLIQVPTGISYDFEPPSVFPGDTAFLRILPTLSGRQEFDLTVRAASQADTLDRELTIVTQSNAYNDFHPVSPVDGTAGILLSAQLAWTDSEDADTYTVELARDPTFSSSALIERRTSFPDTFYTPGAILNESTLFFWRVRPENVCGPGAFSPIQTFHTANTICDENEAGDTPINISGTGLPTIESQISIQEEGIISDINIPFLKANYQPVNSLRISLISPQGTEVILFDENCGNTVNISMGFDDDAPQAITCPPDDGIVFRPVESLSTFIGEPTAGVWTLRVAVVDLGFGASGGLEEWKLEFCSEQQPNPPALVNLDTLFVPPGQTNPITTDQLEVVDPDNSSSELIYTVLSLPANGFLYAYNSLLAVGDQFNHRAIETFDLKYTHVGDETTADEFRLVVEDGSGGFFAPIVVPIRIDEDAVVDVDDPIERDGALRLYPVPANDFVRLEWSEPLADDVQLVLFDLKGRPLQQVLLHAGERERQLSTNHLPAGFYFLRMVDGDSVRAISFTVAR